MTDNSLPRVIWLRVAGMLALSWGYLSMRDTMAGLSATYKTLILLGVTLAGTALIAVWRVDRSKVKSIGLLVAFPLVFGAYYGSVLYLWGTKWGVVPHAVFVLTVLLGPLLTLRRSS